MKPETKEETPLPRLVTEFPLPEKKEDWTKYLTPQSKMLVDSIKEEHEKMMRFIKDLEIK